MNGGYVLAYRDTAGACGEKNNPYNGRRITVEFYYFVNGVYTNYNTASYLHIDGVAPTLAYRANAPWRRWNNPYASSPLWAGNMVEFNLNNLQSGGLYLGTAHNVTQTDIACTTGNHLHQESDGKGVYAPWLALGNATHNRWTDLHYITLSGISGNAP